MSCECWWVPGELGRCVVNPYGVWAQVFFDLMREIRSRKSDDSRATNGDVKGKKRRRIKCNIL